MSLMFAGKERSPYAGMSDAEKDVIIAADELNTAVKAVELEADDLELDLLQAQDITNTAKVNTIVVNLQKKYGSRKLTKPEFMYEANYSESKTKDFLSIYGSFDIGLIALRIVADSNDNTLRDDNHKRLVQYLTQRYGGFLGVPVEHLELEVQEDHKIALPIAKKLMGLKPTAVVKFIPFEVVVDIIMESI